MPTERQRRTLDAPCQQPVTEIVVETPQPVEVDSMLVNPHALREFPLAGGAVPRKEALVQQREPIVRPRITVGRAAANGCTRWTYPDWQ
jgi:hypothetical protein